MGWLLLAALAACGGGGRVDGGGGAGVEVSGARLVAPAGDAPAALYLTLVNRGGEADTLVAVALDAAERTELHETMQHGGMMHMMPVAAVAVLPGDTLRMQPGGTHGMVFGLREGIAPGDTVPGTVQLRRGGTLPIRAAVISYGDLASDPSGRGAEP